MIQIQRFTFNPFQENTYILFDETKECIIIDPGCYDSKEERILNEFILFNNLKPVKLLNTHCHIDHIFGNDFVSKTYNLGLEMHKDDLLILQNAGFAARNYGLNLIPSPEPEKLLEEGDFIEFGNSKLAILHCPGHSPGSIVFYSSDEKLAIGGDVLFQGSIGRTDLPMGNHKDLINAIQQKLFLLADDVVVYSGHGEETTIGEEKMYNPFVAIK